MENQSASALAQRTLRHTPKGAIDGSCSAMTSICNRSGYKKGNYCYN